MIKPLKRKFSFIFHCCLLNVLVNFSCETRGAALAIFNSRSEEQIVRSSIDFSLVPGYDQRGTWIGQLWIGIKRKGSCWVYDNKHFEGVPIEFENFARGEQRNPSDPTQQCLITRYNGWAPMNCNATYSGRKLGIGALCTTLHTSTDNETNNADNMCRVVRIGTLNIINT